MNRGSTKDKAYVSKTPGRTQQVNYYAILPSKTVGKGWGNVGNTNVRGYFIDLPVSSECVLLMFVYILCSYL